MAKRPLTCSLLFCACAAGACGEKPHANTHVWQDATGTTHRSAPAPTTSKPSTNDVNRSTEGLTKQEWSERISSLRAEREPSETAQAPAQPFRSTQEALAAGESVWSVASEETMSVEPMERSLSSSDRGSASALPPALAASALAATPSAASEAAEPAASEPAPQLIGGDPERAEASPPSANEPAESDPAVPSPEDEPLAEERSAQERAAAEEAEARAVEQAWTLQNQHYGLGSRGTGVGIGERSTGYGSGRGDTGFGIGERSTGFGIGRGDTGVGIGERSTGFGSTPASRAEPREEAAEP